MPSVITVNDLAKRYGAVDALDGVSFTVAEGEVLALLGPNGAGKTTAVEILEGYRRADRGEIEVLGYDPATGGREFRDRIGIVLQETGIEPVLSVRETIDLYGASYTRRRPPDELISLVGLEEKADARIKTLSGGQRRRLDLALGLVGDPDLVFLDEPTTGFDPAARRKSWKLVEELTALGKTILLTTHYLDEAQHLADRIVVLNGGRIAAEGHTRDTGRRPTGDDYPVQRSRPARPTCSRGRAGGGRAEGDLPHHRPDRRPIHADGVGYRPRCGAGRSRSHPTKPGGHLPQYRG